MKQIFTITAAACMFIATACTNKNNIDCVNRDCLYQVSTLQALVAGYYYGVTDVSYMLNRGDIGLGTFEGAEGEMIILGGICYQALADGTVKVMDENSLVPFGVSTWFEADDYKTFKGQYDMESFKAELDKIITEKGANTFYVVKMDGFFPQMKVRAIFKQQEPYRELDEVTKTSQVVFDYQDVKGTLVAVYCPSFVTGINAVGWHIHFLSDDKCKGGHVLGFSMTDGTMELDRTDDFYMELPDTDRFNSLNLLGRDKAVGVVEKGEND